MPRYRQQQTSRLVRIVIDCGHSQAIDFGGFFGVVPNPSDSVAFDIIVFDAVTFDAEVSIHATGKDLR